MLKPGQLFASRYRIERELAHGGMGAVFVAEQLTTEARVAIKVLFPHTLSSDAAVVEKFKLEARIAGRVNSEHIVRVLDAGFDEETRMPFLVMELLTGHDLARLVETDGPLSPEKVVLYMAQVAKGLDRAHRYVDRSGTLRPIVHRDLKPENLFLVERDHGEPFMKILDFGIAKVASETTVVSQEVRGTPLFMAYEQAAGEAVSPQTDVWSMGLIVYWLLTGKHYWKAKSREGDALKQLFGELLIGAIPPATERARESGISQSWPVGFDSWFGRCVNRDVRQRFASAGEAVAELGRLFGVRVPSAPVEPVDRAANRPTADALQVRASDVPQPDVETSASPSRPAISVTQRSARRDGSRARRTFVLGAVGLVAIIAIASLLGRGGGQPVQTVSAQPNSPSPVVEPLSVEPLRAAPLSPGTPEPNQPTPASDTSSAPQVSPAQRVAATTVTPMMKTLPVSSSKLVTPRAKKATVYDER